MVKYMVSNISVIEQGSINGVGGSSNGVMGGGIIPFDPPGPIVPPGPTTYLTMDYCGNHVYRNGVMERTMNDYGYQADSTYYYYIKDYQGNVRAVIDQNGVLKEVNNYYPYGGLMGAATAGVQPNKYGGKELERENGIDWYDFEARYQDPMLPMFTTQDPLAEKMQSISPYVYCAGNPIRHVDPSGEDWDDAKIHFSKSFDARVSLGFQVGLSLKAPGVKPVSIHANVLSADIVNTEGPNSFRSGASLGVGVISMECENSAYYIDDDHAVTKKSGSVQFLDIISLGEESTTNEFRIGSDQWMPVDSTQKPKADLQLNEGHLFDKLGIDGSLLIGISITINISELFKAFKSIFE